MTTIRTPLAVLAALFDGLGRYEPAATIAGFALSPFSASAVPKSPPQSPTYATSSVTGNSGTGTGIGTGTA